MSRKYSDWFIVEKINYWQRRIIVWSILYYEEGESIVSDQYFDEKSKLLLELHQNASSDEREQTTYWYVMYDFEGSTGFYIPSRLSVEDSSGLRRIARMVLGQYRDENKVRKCL